VVVGAQFHQQVEHLVDDFGDPGVGPIALVHHHDRLQFRLDRLGQHEPSLRHRAFAGVHQQQATISHSQHPLHLAAEVGVARRVDDVDMKDLRLPIDPRPDILHCAVL
jgi:hypothetical protein